jgi:hypothetical protein
MSRKIDFYGFRRSHKDRGGRDMFKGSFSEGLKHEVSSSDEE